MSDLTLPFMFHPRYSNPWRPGRVWKSAGPQQYPYSKSETTSTDNDTSEFLQYRKYKYGLSHQSSSNLLEEMSKAQVNDEPWPNNFGVLGEVRQVTRQQQQVEEVRGLRPFSVGYPKQTHNQLFSDSKGTTTVPAIPTPSRRPTHRPEPQVGRMLGLGGTTGSGPIQTRPQGPEQQSSTPTIRITRAQELRAQTLRNGAATTTPQGRTPNTPPGRVRGPHQPSPRRGTQDGDQTSPPARSHSNGVSTSGTPSSQARSSMDERSGQTEDLLGQDLGGKESRPSSADSVSGPSPVSEPTNTNLGHKDGLGANVQVGVEVEFLAALESASTIGPPRERPIADRYFIPAEDQHATTLIDGLPARRYIAKLLRDAGIPAVSDYDHRDEVRQAAACFKGQLDEADEYAAWSVKCEPAATVMALDVDIFDYVGLEFASRKLQANAQGFEEIGNVFHILRRHVLVATSTSCGVHVHVDAATLDLQERKHFLCLYLLAEEGLFSLTAPHRRGNNTWCAPVFEKTKLAEDAQDILEETGAHHAEGGDPPRAVKMRTMKALILQECTSTGDLQTAISRNMFPPYHRAALNLKDFSDQSYTFEFRHFQTSLDPNVIEHFVRLCVALVISAKSLGSPGRPSFDEVYDQFLKIKDWKGLLRIIGLERTIGHWERLLRTYPAAPEGSLADTSHSEGDGRPTSFLPPLD